jgi:three-Cys-motif partner protein
LTAAIPPFPESALRAVLAGTVAAWARSGDATSAEDEPRRSYVDAFAGAEFAFGTGVARGAGEEMRAIAAIRAVDEGVTAVLVEEDPAHLQRLYAELEDVAGGERLRATRDLASLARGEVSLVESPFAATAGDVARFAAGGRAFVFLAPPAARALPWDALRPLAALPGATLLIRFPHSDFEKQSAHNSPVADLPGYVKRIVEGCSALLGDAKHAWLPAWRAAAASGGPAAGMRDALARFGGLLNDAAGGRIVKPMHLEAAGGAGAYLFLVTADASLAMAVNAAVRAARLKDRAAAADPVPAVAARAPSSIGAPASLDAPGTTAAAAPASPSADAPAEPAPAPKRKGRASRRQAAEPVSPPQTEVAPADASSAEEPSPAAPPSDGAEATDALPAAVADPEPPAAPKAATEPSTVATPPRARNPVTPPAPVAEALDLFPMDLPQQEILSLHRPDATALASTIHDRFRGQRVAWEDVLRAFSATDSTPEELKKALALLRRGGRAVYKTLKANGDEIDFPAQPAGEPGAKAKPRARKKPEDAGLFGIESEEETE